MYRQGDVLIIPTDRGADGADHRPVPRDRGRVVLAYGEVTGHAHAIRQRGARLYERVQELPEAGERARNARAVADAAALIEDRILEVTAADGVDLVHEEHDTIRLPEGSYVVRRQREYTPAEIVNVAD